MRKTPNRQSERGVALILALFMTVIGSILLGVAAQIFLPDVNFVQKQRLRSEALYAAESGMAQAEAFLYSAFYQRLGDQKAPAADNPLPLNAPRPLGDSVQDPTSGVPINGPDNQFNGVFAELDRYFLWPNPLGSKNLLSTWTIPGASTTFQHGSALDSHHGHIARAVVWPSIQVWPGPTGLRNLSMYKVMITESATTTTNNADDLAIDTYFREVIIRSAGMVVAPKRKSDGKTEKMDEIARAEGSTNPGVTRDRVNPDYVVLLKKKIIFQVKRKRGWQATFLDWAQTGVSGTPVVAMNPPPGQRLKKGAQYVPVQDISIFGRSERVFLNRHYFDGSTTPPTTSIEFEQHYVSGLWTPPGAAPGTPGNFQISQPAEGTGDIGSVAYDYDYVDVTMGPPIKGGTPFLVNPARATLPSLPAQEFVRAVKYYLLGKDATVSEINILAAPSGDTVGGALNGPGYLTQDTSGNNDYVRMNALMQFVSNGTSGTPIRDRNGTVITSFTDLGSQPITDLQAQRLLPRSAPPAPSYPYESQAHTLYNTWQTEFINNYKTKGEFREIPRTDVLIDSTYTDYTLRQPFPGFPQPPAKAKAACPVPCDRICQVTCDVARNPCPPPAEKLNSNKSYPTTDYPLIYSDDPNSPGAFDWSSKVRAFYYGPGPEVTCSATVADAGQYLDQEYTDWILEGETP